MTYPMNKKIPAKIVQRPGNGCSSIVDTNTCARKTDRCKQTHTKYEPRFSLAMYPNAFTTNPPNPPNPTTP